MQKKANQPRSKGYENAMAYANMFFFPEGKQVLADLRRTFYDVSCYAPGDPYATAFMEGQRSVVLYIVSKLKQSKHPEIFDEALDEYNEY